VRFIYWVLLSLVLILSPLNAAPPLPAQKPVPETKTSPQANPGVQRLAFVGLHGGIFEILKRFEEDYQLQLDYFTDEQLASGTVDFSPYRIVFFQHVRGQESRPLPQADILGTKAKSGIKNRLHLRTRRKTSPPAHAAGNH